MTAVMGSLENVGKPVWLALMVAGFVWWWPAGVAILAYLVWSGRLGSWVAMKPWMPNFWGSGNAAFDEHRADVLAQLESEQREFSTFIADLKKAKDKAEFDQFITQRKRKTKR
jgi:hypothetical protein